MRTVERRVDRGVVGWHEMRKRANPGELALVRTAYQVARSKKPISQCADIVKLQAINDTPGVSENGAYQVEGARLQFVDVISHVLTTELKVCLKEWLRSPPTCCYNLPQLPGLAL
jgi:hypothetical protein